MATNDPRREKEQQQRGHNFVTGGQTGPIPSSEQERQEEPLSGLQDRAAQMASAVAATAEKTWDRARESMGDLPNEVGGKAQQLWSSMISCMRRYPLAVFFTGIGLGMVLAHMAERRD